MKRIRFSVLAVSLILALVAGTACASKTKPTESGPMAEESLAPATIETTTEATTLPSTKETTTQEPTKTSQSTAETTVEKKPHVYSELADDLILEDLLAEKGKEDQYARLLKVYEDYHLNNTESEYADPFRNEYIRVSIDSEDAEALALTLDEITDRYNAVRKENAAKIKEDTGAFSWSSFTLERRVKTEDNLGFMTSKTNWIVPGHGFVVLDAYNFDPESGHLLNDDEVLDKIGMDYEALNELLGQNLSGQMIDRGGETLEPEIVTSVEDAKEKFTTGETDGKILLRVKPEQGVLLSGDKMYVVVEAYVAMDDTFSFLQVQEMRLEKNN
jgi:hypothetical protein